MASDLINQPTGLHKNSRGLGLENFQVGGDSGRVELLERAWKRLTPAPELVLSMSPTWQFLFFFLIKKKNVLLEYS